MKSKLTKKNNVKVDIVNILLDDLNYKELLGIINFELKKK